MAITYIPFEELFALTYQLTYISTDGHIDVGPNTYSVFYNRTMQERQVIFQVCEKYLPWQQTQEQEQWERTMYMYQFVIKSPPPFPYSEYKLNIDDVNKVEGALKTANTSEELHDGIEWLIKYCNYHCGECAKDPPNNEACRILWPILGHRETLKRFYKAMDEAKVRIAKEIN